jgi:putative transposase
MGLSYGRDKIYKIAKSEGLLVKKRKNYTRTTNSRHKFNKYPNLLQDMEISQPEEAFVADITYINTRESQMYLHLVTDVYSKRIMGYELSDNLKVSSSKKALSMAIKNRLYPEREAIHHSDRGIQYCSPEYTDMLRENGITVSMTTKYDPYENAVAERVNGILKSEYLIGEIKGSMLQAKRIISQSIRLYNYYRPHMSCNMMTPIEAHKTGEYELKRWGRKFSKRDISLLENKNNIFMQ